MPCSCDPETGVKCVWHFDMDGYVLGKALHIEKPIDLYTVMTFVGPIQTPVEDMPFSVNFLDYDNKELTLKFTTKENAESFIKSMNPERFVECNFALEEET